MTSNSQPNPLSEKKLDQSRATLAFAHRVLIATCIVVSVLAVLMFIRYAAGFSNRIERFILGSVSTAVAARAHCSVEVVRELDATKAP